MPFIYQNLFTLNLVLSKYYPDKILAFLVYLFSKYDKPIWSIRDNSSWD